MAMTKVEMEQHRASYHELVARARAAFEHGHLAEAIKLAESSWDHTDGMLQYERRYADAETVRIEAVHIVLEAAPVLFDVESLDRLEALLKSQRRIQRCSPDKLTELLANARRLVWEAYRLWNRLESSESGRPDNFLSVPENEADDCKRLVRQWELMGVVERMPEGSHHRLVLATRMDAPVSGKCPSCGAVGKAPKVKLLDERSCPRCKRSVCFVLQAASTV